MPIMPDYTFESRTLDVDKKKFVDPNSKELLTSDDEILRIYEDSINILLLTCIHSDGEAAGFNETDILFGGADKDKVHKHDEGTLAAGITGAITQVTASGLTKTPPAPGTLRPVNSQLDGENITYTTFEKSGDNYVFTVNKTLDHTYALGDKLVVEDPLMVSINNDDCNIAEDWDQINLGGGLIAVRLNSDRKAFGVKMEANSGNDLNGYIGLKRSVAGSQTSSPILQDRCKFIGSVRKHEGEPPEDTYEFWSISQLDGRFQKLLALTSDIGRALADTDLLFVSDKKCTLSNLWTWLQTQTDAVYSKTTDIINNLTSTDINKPLSASQGKYLNDNKADKSSVLELDNTTPFAPSADYHPATKKYVDDVANTIGKPVTFAANPSWDASGGVFPTETVQGKMYICTGPGTVDGKEFNTNDTIVSLIATPSTTVYAGNWHHTDNTESPDILRTANIGNGVDQLVKRPADNAVAADSIQEITVGNGVNVDGLVVKDGALTNLNGLNLSSSAVTIATGVATVAKSLVVLSGEGNAADELATITATGLNFIAVLFQHKITIQHGTGNIITTDGSDFNAPANSAAIFINDGTNWRIVGGGGSGSGNIIFGSLPLAETPDTDSWIIDIDSQSMYAYQKANNIYVQMGGGAPGNTGMSNPTTTEGDLIVAGAGGAPGRLGIGTNGKILTVVNGVPAWAAERVEYPFAASDEDSDLEEAAAIYTGRSLCAMTLTGARVSVKTAPVGAKLTIDIKVNGTSIFSTLLTIDDGAKTSVTASVPAVISNTSVADNAEITVDITQVGSTTKGAGLKLCLYGTRG